MLSIAPNVVAGELARPPAYCDPIVDTGAVFSVLLNLSAAEATLSEIDQTLKSEPSEDKPTAEIVSAAKAMIMGAAEPVPFFLAASEVEGFEGRLLVHWTLAAKRVTLIASGPEVRMKLYKKTHPTLSELIPNPSPADLHSALTWILGM